MKVVEDCASSLEVQNNIQPSRYFRSSLKIVRMADEFLDEGRLEKPCILNRKFVMCFKKASSPSIFCKCVIVRQSPQLSRLREVVPKTEKLKTCLLEQYTREYKQHCEEHQKLKEKRGLKLQDKEDKGKQDKKNLKLLP